MMRGFWLLGRPRQAAVLESLESIDDGSMKVVRTNKVILALPAAALERIEFVTSKTK